MHSDIILFLGGFLGGVFFSVVFLWIIFKMDERWYKRHPGEEEKLGRIDAELKEKERWHKCQR